MYPKTRKVTVALIGCGAVSRLFYTPALRELESHALVKVTAICDPNMNNAVQVRSSFPSASVSQSVTDLILQDQPELAIVASPPLHHAEQTIRLLEAGMSVLCEKPMATSVAEAETMVKAASSASGVLAIGMSRRFFPATQTIRRILSLNVLGDILSFSFFEGGEFQWPVSSPSYFKKQAAQGVLMDIGVHALDLMLWWFGEPVGVRYADDMMGGIEANCQLLCTFEQGFSGELRLSRDCTLANRYTIHGTKGWLSWIVNEANRIEVGFEQERFALNAAIHEIETRMPSPRLGRPAFPFEQSFVSQICNVIAAMENKEPLFVPAVDGIKCMRIIECCYRHRELMAMPWLGDQEVIRAQQLNQA